MLIARKISQMLKCFLLFSHSFLISFVFSFPYIYLLLDKFFASICLIVCCYNYSTSLCYQSIVVLQWLTWIFLYVSCSKLFWCTTLHTIFLAIVIELDLLQHSILALDLLQFCNIVCASLSFHSPLLVIYFKLCYSGNLSKSMHACL